MPLASLVRHRVILLGFCKSGEVQDSFGRWSPLRRRTEKECYSYRSLVTCCKERSAKDYSSSMEWSKKRKPVNPAWRPVSTMSGLKADKSEVSEVEGVLLESACSSVLPDNVEIKTAEEASDLSIDKHSVSIEVGASLMRFIKGKGGAMQKSIEEEMGVKIIFPSDSKADSIVIQGDSANITKAADKIQTIISEVPVLDFGEQPNNSDEETEAKSDDASDNVSKDETKCQISEKAPAVEVKLNVKDLGIDKSIFIKPKTFHLTVLMLKLWNKERVHAAKEVLESISTEVMDALDGRPLSVRLKGLDCMRGSLAKARVLYAPVEEIGNEDRLMRACQVIIDAYIKAGLVLEKDARQKLKLHATLMNARHGKRKINNKRMDSFDARGIFEKYGSEEWGEYHIREAHLSQRFVFDDSGYYRCCASLPFPTSTGVE